MEPERESPYWKPIVGDNWPEIPPSDWNALETSARDGADALDLQSLEQARRGFDDTVRASIGLQPVKDDMRDQQWHPRAFADALYAAADTFGEFSDRVRRTRNQILDIVDRATRRIGAAYQAEPDADSAEDDEARQERIQQRVRTIIAEAKAEVEDVVRSALQTISPTGLPWLAKIAEELGQPDPWEPGPQDDRGAPSHHSDDRHPDRHHSDTHHPGVHDTDGPLPGLPTPLDPALDLGPATPYPAGSDPSGYQPAQVIDGRPISGPAVVAPAQPGYGPASAAPTDGVVGVNYAPTAAPTTGAEMATAGNSPRVSPSTASTDAVGAEAPGDASAHGAADSSDTAMASARTDAADAEAQAQAQFGMPLFAGGAAAVGPSAGVPGSVSSGTAPTGTGVSAPASQTRQPITTADARGAVPDARSSVPDQRSAPAGPPKVVAASGNSAGVSASPAKQPLPHRSADAEAARTNPGRADTGGSDELIRDAVGAAMLSAAAPTFVLGERVDGDLVLARTILGVCLPRSARRRWACPGRYRCCAIPAG